MSELSSMRAFLQSALNAAKDANVEVEVRIGRMSVDGKHFVPGVTEEHFERLVEKLTASAQCRGWSQEIDYTYDTPRDKNIRTRVCYDTDLFTTRATHCVKTGLMKRDFPTDTPYILRLVASLEQPVSACHVPRIVSATTSVAVKTRMSAELPSSLGKFGQVDVARTTRGTTREDAEASVVVYKEIEVEYTGGSACVARQGALYCGKSLLHRALSILAACCNCPARIVGIDSLDCLDRPL